MTRNWPRLQALQEEGCLEKIELFLADFILSSYPEADEAQAAFLCYLYSLLREGHICARLQDGQLNPDPKIWLRNTSIEIGELISRMQLAAHEFPSSIMSIASEDIPLTPLCHDQNRIYFQKYWVEETRLLNAFFEFIHHSPHNQIDESYVLQEVQKMIATEELLPEQGLAILSGCKHPFTIISGGPGTGKTYTAGHLIKLFWNALPLDKKNSCKIAIAAPTGKAASNLQRSLSNALKNIEHFPIIQSQTLHALLQVGFSKDKKPKKLTEDLILVDESSMIDLRMMSRLFEAIKPGCRLILLGDKHQLPAVEAGAVFADLLAYLKTHNPEQAIELTHCLRIEKRELIELATAVKNGDVDLVSAVNFQNLPNDKNQIKQFYQSLSETAQKHFQTDALGSSEDLLESFLSFRFLSPLRKGPFGVNKINEMLARHFHTCRAIPILITESDYHLQLYNGEVGVLIKSSHAIFPDPSGTKKVRMIPEILLPKYEHAYCLSVHKSQGSEFDHILLILPDGSQHFGREVLYTAITRCRKSLEIWGERSILQETIKKQSTRFSGIIERLTR